MRACVRTAMLFYRQGRKMESGQAVQGQVGDDDGNVEHPGAEAGGEPTSAALLEGVYRSYVCTASSPRNKSGFESIRVFCWLLSPSRQSVWRP